jgi:hypothetical protein
MDLLTQTFSVKVRNSEANAYTSKSALRWGRMQAFDFGNEGKGTFRRRCNNSRDKLPSLISRGKEL